MKLNIQHIFIGLGLLFIVKIMFADQLIAQDHENIKVVRNRMLSH